MIWAPLLATKFSDVKLVEIKATYNCKYQKYSKKCAPKHRKEQYFTVLD